jgi:hypothetical protein
MTDLLALTAPVLLAIVVAAAVKRSWARLSITVLVRGNDGAPKAVLKVGGAEGFKDGLP